MECDSIMDISINLNIDDMSVFNEVSMDITNAVTPVRQESWIQSQTEHKIETISSNDVFEKMRRNTALMPNLQLISERCKSNLAAANEKVKAAESELGSYKLKLEDQKKSLAEENSKLQVAKEETKTIESKLTSTQNKIRSLTKEIEDMKHETSSSDKENISDKSRVNLYRQLTGVTFGNPNSNSPHELTGFATGVGPTTNLKTFTFNTTEHSTSLMGGYIWNVLEFMHKPNWETLGKE